MREGVADIFPHIEGPLITETPPDKRVKIEDLFEFKRGRGDVALSVLVLIIVAFLLITWAPYTGWFNRDVGKLPDQPLVYMAQQVCSLGKGFYAYVDYLFLGGEEATRKTLKPCTLGVEGRVKSLSPIVKQGWYAALVALIILTPAALINLGLSLRNALKHRRQLLPNRTLYELEMWARALEYVVYFFVYTAAVVFFGYLLSTLGIALYLTWRLGYRTRQWMGIAFVTALAIVLVFKTFLEIKITNNIWLYNQLPEAMGAFMKAYF